MKTASAATFLLILTIATGFAQEKLGEMALGDLEQRSVVVRSRDRAALIVVSEVADLTFESTRKIHAIRARGASEWQLLLEPGRQIVTVRAPGYQPVKTAVINLQVKRAYRIKVTQVKAIPGTISITSNPPDAEILLNGVKIEGQTPFRLEQALPGKFNIEVRKDGFRPASRTLEVRSSEITEWDVELTQTAVKVKIELQNKQVQEVGILVNGEPKGVAPGAILLEPGSYQIVLQKPGYRYPEKVINIEFGPEEITLSEKLIPLKRPFYTKWWFLAGSAAVLTGGTAILTSGKSTEPLTGEPPVFPGK